MQARAIIALFVVLAAGCHNPCQQLCVRMADYAEECGFTVPDSEVDACIEEQAKPDDKQVCRDFGDAETIRDEWSCEELAAYFE